MPELDDALVKLSSWLTENEIRHMVIGGFAVTVWGEPRFTRDLDVTVSVPPPQIRADHSSHLCAVPFSFR